MVPSNLMDVVANDRSKNDQVIRNNENVDRSIGPNDLLAWYLSWWLPPYTSWRGISKSPFRRGERKRGALLLCVLLNYVTREVLFCIRSRLMQFPHSVPPAAR